VGGGRNGVPGEDATRKLGKERIETRRWRISSVAPGPGTAANPGNGIRQTRCVALAPDGVLLALGGTDGVIVLWDLAARREQVTLPGRPDVVVSDAFSPDGQLPASAGGRDGWPGEIKVWDMAARRELTSLRGHTDAVNTGSSRPAAAWFPPAPTAPSRSGSRDRRCRAA
jgi:WD40 repeat protein